MVLILAFALLMVGCGSYIKHNCEAPVGGYSACKTVVHLEAQHEPVCEGSCKQ